MAADRCTVLYAALLESEQAVLGNPWNNDTERVFQHPLCEVSHALVQQRRKGDVDGAYLCRTWEEDIVLAFAA